MERSHLRYLVHGLSYHDTCLGKLKIVLNCLIDNSLLFEHKQDIVCAQYIQFCQEKRHELQICEKDQECLDIFFVHLLKHDSSFSQLWAVMKVLLMLSHGQAAMERGFSMNKQIVVEDIAEILYISQRVICRL